MGGTELRISKKLKSKTSYILKKQHTSGASMPSGKLALFIVLLVCFTAGFYDEFFGPGTGSLMIILFHYVVKFTLLEASATSKIFNFAFRSLLSIGK